MVEFLIQSLGFEVSDERVDERAELAVHRFGELVKSKVDAVVGDAILREIVGAYFFGAVASLDLPFSFSGEGGVLLFLFHFVEPRPEHAHSFRAILDLRFFVLL